VHALESLHAALRPHGLILDVRPAQMHPTVQLLRRDVEGSRLLSVRIGQLDDSFRIGTLATADAALQTLIDAGQLVREHAEAFTFVYHFDGVPSWLTYMAEQWATVNISDALIARAKSELAVAPGELQILRTLQASRLRRA
jgi:hypothetical protein